MLTLLPPTNNVESVTFSKDLDLSFVQGVGYQNSPIVVVGSCPNRLDLKYKQGFSNTQGRLLRKGMAAAGFNLNDIYYTYTVKVCPEPHKSRPNRKEIDSWVPYLKGELTFYFRDTIICVGQEAEYAVLQFARDNGIWVKGKAPQVYIVPSPSGPTFKQYVDMLSRIKHNTYNYSPEHVKYYKLDRQTGLITLK